MDTPLNKEQVYDTQISPLMVQIIEICNTNKIAFLASFSIPTEEAPELACSSALLEDDFKPPASLRAAWEAIRPRRRNSVLTMRTEHSDGSTTLTAIVG
jgi:hypothetical protein